MSRRAIFAYEQGLRGPSPVVFYDEIPKRDGKPVALLAFWEIEGGTSHPRFFPGADETPHMGHLQEFFPLPRPPEPEPASVAPEPKPHLDGGAEESWPAPSSNFELTEATAEREQRFDADLEVHGL